MKTQTRTLIIILWVGVSLGVYARQQDRTARFLQHDLSCLFDSLTTIGILGDDCSRIDIRFDRAAKRNDAEYAIKGASRTRLAIICRFEGAIRIDSISFEPRMKCECTDVDGFVFGHYRFAETGSNSGVFSGTFKQAYRIDSNRQIMKGYNIISELKMNLSEYAGSWKSNRNGVSKVCCWADGIIPRTPEGFCRFNDACDWIVEPAYRKNGWDNLYSAYYDYGLNAEERQKFRAREELVWW